MDLCPLGLLELVYTVFFWVPIQRYQQWVVLVFSRLLDQCPMPLNADKDHDIDCHWSALGIDWGSPDDYTFQSCRLQFRYGCNWGPEHVDHSSIGNPATVSETVILLEGEHIIKVEMYGVAIMDGVRFTSSMVCIWGGHTYIQSSMSKKKTINWGGRGLRPLIENP